MRFWCAADGSAWTWAWRPYLGSWLVTASLAIAMWRAGAFAPTNATKRKAAVVTGMALILVSIEWPLAALGAGYLASAQMVRQVLVVLVAVPLILYGSPASIGRWLTATSSRRRVLRVLTTPLLALPGAAVLLIVVNLPIVVDPLVKTQIGSFAVDLLWLAAGVLMWMPVQPPQGMEPRLQGVLSTVYLIGVSVAPLPVAFFMTWSDLPLFEVYELAPRVFPRFDAVQDQEFAASIFQVGGGLIIWAQIAVRFMRMAGGLGPQGPRGRLVVKEPEPEVV